MSSIHFATLAVHAGSEPDASTGAVVPPISLATTFSQIGLGQKHGIDDRNSFGKGFEYSRTGNPTRGSFERAIAAVERGTFGLAFASGLAATNAIIQTLKSGDHVICIDDVYGGTQRLFRQIVGPGSALSFTFIDMSNSNLQDAITPATRLIWLEVPNQKIINALVKRTCPCTSQLTTATATRK